MKPSLCATKVPHPPAPPHTGSEVFPGKWGTVHHHKPVTTVKQHRQATEPVSSYQPSHCQCTLGLEGVT